MNVENLRDAAEMADAMADLDEVAAELKRHPASPEVYLRIDAYERESDCGGISHASARLPKWLADEIIDHARDLLSARLVKWGVVFE